MSTKESRGVTACAPLAQWFVDNSVDIEKCCIPHVFVEQNYNVAAGLFETAEAKAVELGFEDWIMYGAFEASQEAFWKNLFVGRWSAMTDTDGVVIDPIPGDALPHAVRVRLV